MCLGVSMGLFGVFRGCQVRGGSRYSSVVLCIEFVVVKGCLSVFRSFVEYSVVVLCIHV